MKEFLSDLCDEFGDADFAHGYLESHSVSRIAAQVHAIRKQRKWSQTELAARAGIAQERVSKIENADFTSLTMATLRKLARAFDIDVRIAFTSVSDGILDVAKLDPAKLEVCDRQTDLARFRHYVGGTEWKSAGAIKLLATSSGTAMQMAQVADAPVVAGQWQVVTRTLAVSHNG